MPIRKSTLRRLIHEEIQRLQEIERRTTSIAISVEGSKSDGGLSSAERRAAKKAMKAAEPILKKAGWRLSAKGPEDAIWDAPEEISDQEARKIHKQVKQAAQRASDIEPIIRLGLKGTDMFGGAIT